MAALEDSWDVDTEEKCDLNCKAQRQYGATSVKASDHNSPARPARAAPVGDLGLRLTLRFS